MINLLQTQKVQQAEQRLMAGPAREGSELMFTNEFVCYVSCRAIYESFKGIVRRIGIPTARIHALRHTYAVLAIKSGTTLRQYRRTWAMPQRPLRWTFTAM